MDKDKGVLTTGQTPKRRQLRFPKARGKPELCDHGCGHPAVYGSCDNVWRCAKNVTSCPAIKKRLAQHIREHAYVFTAQDRAEAGERAKRLYQGEGNPIFGTKRSQQTRRKISDARVKSGVARGDKNPNWRGGVSIASRTARYTDMTTSRYKNWRLEVFQRDAYTCQECGAKNGQGKKIILNADHIKPYAGFPELRYDVANGRTLCLPCHKKTYRHNLSILKALIAKNA